MVPCGSSWFKNCCSHAVIVLLQRELWFRSGNSGSTTACEVNEIYGLQAGIVDAVRELFSNPNLSGIVLKTCCLKMDIG